MALNQEQAALLAAMHSLMIKSGGNSGELELSPTYPLTHLPLVTAVVEQYQRDLARLCEPHRFE